MMVRGFLLNNELTDFSPRPEVGRQAGGTGCSPASGRARSMSPTFVLDRDGRLVAAGGSAGGSRIIGDTLQKR